MAEIETFIFRLKVRFEGFSVCETSHVTSLILNSGSREVRLPIMNMYFSTIKFE